MPSESSYWIVSVPVQEEKAPEQMLLDVSSQLLREKACAEDDVAALLLPPLKTGTLESLIVLADDMPKLDGVFSSVSSRIVDTLRALLNDDIEALNEHLTIDNLSVEDYLMDWRWNAGKYRADKGLNEILEMLGKIIDHAMKQKLSAYNTAKSQLQQLERRKQCVSIPSPTDHSGNLTMCSLADIVRREDLVDPNSEFLCTLFVVVPKMQTKDWLNKYERLTSLVVPRSSTQLAQDEEYTLFNVTVFKKVRDEFTQKARESKFQVREFTWDEDLLERERKELYEAGVSEKELWTELLRLSRSHFDDAFQALTHFKVIRTFVESVLRFGLPANYFAMIVRPTAKTAKPLADSLTKFYGYLGEYLSRTEKSKDSTQPHQETPGEFVNLLEQEVFPFVLVELPMITVD